MYSSEYRAMASVEQTHWWFVSRRRFFEVLFAKFGIAKGGDQVFVDIGAGTGGMIPFLRTFGQVIGIEPSKIGRTLAKEKGIILLNATATQSKLPSQSADVVCFFDVLYHKDVQVNEALLEAKRILKPGGFLMISDCAFPFLASPHDIAVNTGQRFTRATLTKYVKDAGFSLRYSTYSFFLLFPVFAFWRLAYKLMPQNKKYIPVSDVGSVLGWLNTMLVHLCLLETSWYGKVTYPWGSSVIVVSQKPVLKKI